MLYSIMLQPDLKLDQFKPVTHFKTGQPDLKPTAQLTGFNMGQLLMTHFKTGQPVLKH